MFRCHPSTSTTFDIIMSTSQFRRDMADALLRERSGPRQSLRDGNCLTQSAEPLSLGMPLAEIGPLITPATLEISRCRLQATFPRNDRSPLENDNAETVRFFHLIHGWRHRQTTEWVYENFMSLGFFRIEPLCPSAVNPRRGPHTGLRHHRRENVHFLECRRSSEHSQLGYRFAIHRWAR